LATSPIKRPPRHTEKSPSSPLKATSPFGHARGLDSPGPKYNTASKSTNGASVKPLGLGAAWPSAPRFEEGLRYQHQRTAERTEDDTTLYDGTLSMSSDNHLGSFLAASGGAIVRGPAALQTQHLCSPSGLGTAQRSPMSDRSITPSPYHVSRATSNMGTNHYSTQSAAPSLRRGPSGHSGGRSYAQLMSLKTQVEQAHIASVVARAEAIGQRRERIKREVLSQVLASKEDLDAFVTANRTRASIIRDKTQETRGRPRGTFGAKNPEERFEEVPGPGEYVAVLPRNHHSTRRYQYLSAPPHGIGGVAMGDGPGGMHISASDHATSERPRSPAANLNAGHRAPLEKLYRPPETVRAIAVVEDT
jgi:hypothetical protein